MMSVLIMKLLKLLGWLSLVIFVAGVAWLGWLYTVYGQQTLLFLVRSSPDLLWTYSQAMVAHQDDSGKGLFNTGVLERPQASLPPIATKHTIATMNHVYQKLNNCGPSSALMAASTLGVIFDQPFAAERLKGGPGDKNVGPHELAGFLEDQGLKVAYRVNGNAGMLEQFVARDIPVIVEQWLVKRGSNELVGHYRVVRGYDQSTHLFTTNDSFNGPNFVIPYGQFDEWWRPFNRTYLVVYKPEQEAIVRQILGPDWEETLNYTEAVRIAQAETESVGDGYSYFNLGTSHVLLHEYAKAEEAYNEALSHTFPPFFLWYQFGPLEAYYHQGRAEKVLSMTDQLLRSAGESEEAHYYRERAYRLLNKSNEAEAEATQKLEANPRFTPPFE